jgi:hypothetical protein
MTTTGTESSITTSGPLNEPEAGVAAQLHTVIRGEVITRNHPAYDEARAVYNKMIDRRPAVVVRCVDEADVIAALNVARLQRLPLAVRGGGHSAPGYGVVEDGVVIDLAPMRHVVVDSANRRAIVGGGAKWADVDHATAPFGLALPGGVVSTTGVGGLALGGGSGHLTRSFGLTCDSLIGATVVTADGRVLHTSEASHPELFWALRGGGGNFGIVTSFEFALHPLGDVLSAIVIYDIGAAGDILRFFDDFMKRAPDELNAFIGFGLAPPIPSLDPSHHERPAGLVVACWTGEHNDGYEALRPLLEHPATLGSLVEPLPLAALNSMFDAGAPAGMHNYWRGHFVDELTDDIIRVHATFGPTVPNVSSTIHLYTIDGAAGRVPSDATAFCHRNARYSTVVGALWTDAGESDAYIGWVRDYWAALNDVAPNGGYVNFLSVDDGEAGVRATYGPNHERLTAVKLAYDSQNLFCHNQNIKPVR